MKKLNRKGFTLVEMLVVIAIIAILVSILIPTVMGATTKAKAATDAANLRSAIAEFEIEYLGGSMNNFAKITDANSNETNFLAYKIYPVTSKSDSSNNVILIQITDRGADACFVSATSIDSDGKVVIGNVTFNQNTNIDHYAKIAGGETNG
jgi:type IV pilus assembly protein PilA